MDEAVKATLERLGTAAREVLGDDLRSIVLFGSGAEDALRPTSDLNLIFVLRAFEPSHIDGLREPLRTAQAACKLVPMFLLEREIELANELFADKFADVQRRRRVLFGEDPFAGRAPSRAAELARLRQVLFNLELRLRQHYALLSLRAEQAALTIADSAGPLRSAAAALFELRGKPAESPKAALAQFVSELGDAALVDAVDALSIAREQRLLPSGDAAPSLARLIAIAHALREEVERLRTETHA